MCPCACELVDGEPRSRETLEYGEVYQTSGFFELVDCTCRRCGARLQCRIPEWGPDAWTRTPGQPPEMLEPAEDPDEPGES